MGAGPGGSNAVAAALRGGLSVCQLERQAFPRTKPCAGGLTAKAWNALRADLAPSLRREFQAFEFAAWRGKKRVFRYRQRFLAMVRRPELDNDLVRQNLASPGFDFHDEEPLRDVAWTGAHFVLTTTRRTLRARQLVAADGANGTLNRTFGISHPRGRAVAVEIEPRRDELAGDLPEHPCFDFGAIERGYGWIFPKGEHVSIGLYAICRSGEAHRDLRGQLVAYLSERGLAVAGDPLATFVAHTIPLGGFRLKVPEAPVYLVGDAGGFADALTGEGIYHALESGRLAGETAVEVARAAADHRTYYRRLRRRVLADTALSWFAAGPFYKRVSWSLRLLRSPLLWRPLVEGYGCGATLYECVTRGGLYLVRSLRAPARKRKGTALRNRA